MFIFSRLLGSRKFSPSSYCVAPMACGRFPSWRPPWSVVEHAVSLASTTPGMATRSEPPTAASRLSVRLAGFGRTEEFRCGFRCGHDISTETLDVVCFLALLIVLNYDNLSLNATCFNNKQRVFCNT